MKNIWFAIFGICACQNIGAQEFECTTDVCSVKQEGKYAIELAGCAKALQLYVYDSHLQPLSGAVISGFAEFYYNDSSCRSSLLYQTKNTNSITAKIPEQDYIIVRLTLIIGKETVFVSFDNECEGP